MEEYLENYNEEEEQNTNSSMILTESTIQEDKPKANIVIIRDISEMIKIEVPNLAIKDGILSLNGQKQFEYNFDDIVNKCQKCFLNDNFFFCEICQKNICKNCIDNCEAHIIKNLQEQKEASDKIKLELNNILSKYFVRPGENIIIRKSDENLDDIEGINKIFQKYYFNYFHFQNIVKCQEYLKDLNKKTYNKDCIKIIYNVTNCKGKELIMFGRTFVENNKEKIYLLINDEISELIQAIKIDNDKDYLEVILIRIDNGKNINIDNMSCMFCGCEANEIKISEVKNGTLLDLTHVTNIINMFKNCSNLKTINLNFLKNATNIIYMDSLFNGCKKLEKIFNIDKLEAKSVIGINNIFSFCKNLKYLEGLNNWKINKVKQLIEIFKGCSSLETVPDISKWKVGNVTSMDGMFKDCNSLKSLPDISQWDVKNVKSMKSMFNGCSLLVNLPDIFKWNVENVENMKRMFKGCEKLHFHNLKQWKLKSIKHIHDIFFNCRALKYTDNIHKIEDILNVDNIVEKGLANTNEIEEINQKKKNLF